MNVIFCASKFEILGFLRKLKILKKSAIGNSIFYSCIFENKKKVMVVTTGMGKKAAESACQHFLELINTSGCDAINTAGSNTAVIVKNDTDNIDESSSYNEDLNIIITGFSGSLTKVLKIGDIVLINEVVKLEKKYIDSKNSRFVVSDRIKINNSISRNIFLKVPEPALLLGSKSGRIYTEAICATVDEVINNNNQKLSTASVSGADIIDMETYSIIKNLKNLKNKSFVCIRTISDDSENNLPDFVNFFSNYYPASGFKAFPGYYLTLYLKDFFKLFAALILKPVNIRRFFMFLKNISFAEKTLSMAIEKLMKKY